MIRMVLMSVLMLLVFTSTAFSQFTFDFTGTGARAQGMGNAFIAVSDDASAASWNPAGLTVHEKLLMGFDYTGFSPDNEFAIGSSTYIDNPSFGSVSQFSIISPFRLRGRLMVFGLSYGKCFEEFWNDGYDYVGTFRDTILNGIITDTSSIESSRLAEAHTDLSVLNIAAGTKFSPEFSVGASINIYTGERVSVVNTKTSIPHFMSAITYPQYVEYFQSVEIIDTAVFSGVNLTFSGKYVGEKFDLGLVIRTPFDLNAESDTKVNFRTVENGLLQRVGSDTVYVDNQLVKVSVPWIFGIGAALHPTDDVTLSADFEYRGFGGQELLVRDSIHIKPGSANEEFFSVYDRDNFNSAALRAGVEYNWKTPWESFPVIPLRAGFSTVSTMINQVAMDVDPNDGIDVAPGILDQSSWTNIHLGLGVKWSQIYLDAAVTFSTIDLPMSNPMASWDNSNTSFVFGFTGYF